MKRYNLSEKVHEYLVYSDGNIVYQDSYYFDSLVKEYGYQAVKEEIARQKKVLQ